jgi:HEPN domain-containing protein
MVGEESLYPAHWLRLAERDLRRVERLLDADDPELAGFCLQQAVEKFLKSFLLSRGWGLQRIHDLEALLNAALVYDPSLEPFHQVCEKITAFYLIERYPLITDTGLTKDEVYSSLEQVTELIEKLRAGIAE